MKRFVFEEHREISTNRPWWTIIDTGWEGTPKREQVGINFATYDNVQLVVNALNAEWEAFRRNPW
jgi:hypothetical protein